MRTIVYVDGFNLYNRALVKTKHKWLNLHSLAVNVLSSTNQVIGIRYYTAPVSGRRDPDQPVRQGIYLRALLTLPNTEIHYGKFMEKVITRPLVAPIQGLPRYVDVHTTEEKGSDVNLAAHLVRDAYLDRFDVGVVISKDTDLAEPIRIVAKELGKPVGILCPDASCPTDLRSVASFVRYIGNSHLSQSQFPVSIQEPSGKTITKPAAW